MIGARAALSLGLLCALGVPTRAEPAQRCQAVDRLELVQGLVSPGARCGELVLATNGAATSFSYGWVRDRAPVALPYRMRVDVRRLSADANKPIELHLVGVIVLVRDGAIGFYDSDAGFAESGWQPVSELHTHDLLHIEARQDHRGVRVWIGDREVGRWRSSGAVTGGRLGVGFKGYPGYRSRMWLGRLEVESQRE